MITSYVTVSSTCFYKFVLQMLHKPCMLLYTSLSKIFCVAQNWLYTPSQVTCFEVSYLCHILFHLFCCVLTPTYVLYFPVFKCNLLFSFMTVYIQHTLNLWFCNVVYFMDFIKSFLTTPAHVHDIFYVWQWKYHHDNISMIWQCVRSFTYNMEALPQSNPCVQYMHPTSYSSDVLRTLKGLLHHSQYDHIQGCS